MHAETHDVSQVSSLSTSLAQILVILTNTSWVFVTFETAGEVITPDDLAAAA
jgi:hypothetical protein